MGRGGCSGEDICFAKNGACVPCPVQARQAGQPGSWRALITPPPGAAEPRRGNPLQCRQEVGGRLGPLEDRPLGPSRWGGGGTLDQIQPPQYTWAHLKSVRSLGSGLPLLPPSHLPTPFPFFLSWPPSPSTSFLFLFLAPPTPPEAFC